MTPIQKKTKGRESVWYWMQREIGGVALLQLVILFAGFSSACSARQREPSVQTAAAEEDAAESNETSESVLRGLDWRIQGRRFESVAGLDINLGARWQYLTGHELERWSRDAEIGVTLAEPELIAYFICEEVPAEISRDYLGTILSLVARTSGATPTDEVVDIEVAEGSVELHRFLNGDTDALVGAWCVGGSCFQVRVLSQRADRSRVEEALARFPMVRVLNDAAREALRRELVSDDSYTPPCAEGFECSGANLVHRDWGISFRLARPPWQVFTGAEAQRRVEGAMLVVSNDRAAIRAGITIADEPGTQGHELAAIHEHVVRSSGFQRLDSSPREMRFGSVEALATRLLLPTESGEVTFTMIIARVGSRIYDIQISSDSRLENSQRIIDEFLEGITIQEGSERR